MSAAVQVNPLRMLPADRLENEWVVVVRNASAKKSPNTTISRLNHDWRRPRKEREAFRGLPSCKVATARPRAPLTSAPNASSGWASTATNGNSAKAPAESCVSVSIHTSGQWGGCGNSSAASPGMRSGAILAADALIIEVPHNAGKEILLVGPHRTAVEAGWVNAVVTRRRDRLLKWPPPVLTDERADVAPRFAVVEAIEGVAGGHAGLATAALVEIDLEGKLFPCAGVESGMRSR